MRYLFCLLSLILLLACHSAAPKRDRKPTHAEKIAVQEEILRRQEEEMVNQKREIEDLKRQEYYNKSLRRFE